jgi:hypothetical protein
VVLPEPEGAVMTMIFPFAKKFENYLRIKEKSFAFLLNDLVFGT